MQGVPVSKESAIISKEWKKVKVSEKKMKKYKDLYEEEKQRHEEALQIYQEDHGDEMEIIRLYKRCNKTKAVAKTASKPSKSRYHLFLREQLDEMIGEDRKNYRSIVTRRWKEIKEDPAKLSEYNDRARQMQNDGSQNEKTPTAKHPQKYQKYLSLLIQTLMIWTMNKNLPQNCFKKHKKPLGTQTMNKSLQ